MVNYYSINGVLLEVDFHLASAITNFPLLMLVGESRPCTKQIYWGSWDKGREYSLEILDPLVLVGRWLCGGSALINPSSKDAILAMFFSWERPFVVTNRAQLWPLFTQGDNWLAVERMAVRALN